MAQLDATITLTSAGLTLGTVTTMSSETIAPGIVISQAPDAGTTVPTRTAVSVVVSSGSATVLVPQLVGLTQSAATAALTAARFTVGAITTVTSTAVPAGSVIDQTPAAGESVSAGTSVALLISAGPAPVTVPDVVNLTKEDGSAALLARGLAVGTITRLPLAAGALDRGLTLALDGIQDPGNVGTLLALTVSSGPSLTTWKDQDVGAVGLAGSSSFASGTDGERRRRRHLGHSGRVPLRLPASQWQRRHRGARHVGAKRFAVGQGGCHDPPRYRRGLAARDDDGDAGKGSNFSAVPLLEERAWARPGRW
jgi:hypothetical protein